MPLYAGFDTSIYPGDQTIQWLKSHANLSWVGFYLAKAPNHADKSWMGKLNYLRGLSLGVAPIYVGLQSAVDQSAETGARDGREAADLADGLNFTKGVPGASTVVYLDLEDGGTLPDAAVDYYTAWVGAVTAAGYAAGVYCSHSKTLDQMLAAATAIPWIFNVKQKGGTTSIPFATDISPSDPRARCMQYIQDVTITLDDGTILNGDNGKVLTVDVDVSTVPDPGIG